MIIVCEPQCAGLEHVEVNSAFLAVLKAAYPGKKILFSAEESHIEHVKIRLKEHSIEDIDFVSVTIPKRSLLNYQRFFIELRLIRSIFDKAVDMKAEKIIFTSTTSAGLVAIKALLREYRSVRCMIILHAILESVLKKRPPLKPLALKSYLELPFWFRLSFPYGNTERIRYIVLGQTIRDNLCQLFPKLQEQTLSIDHPYFYKAPSEFKPFKDGIVRFGSIGVASRSKGSDSFFKIAKEMKSSEFSQKTSFMHIGPMDKKIQVKGDYVEIPQKDSFLSRAEYDRHLSCMDYGVFFHRPTSYRLTASGSLLDAFSHLKPLIALRNPFFEYFFKIMGDIGYLCDDYDDMRSTMARIVEDNPAERYMTQRDNILNGRKKIDIPEIGKKMRLWD